MKNILIASLLLLTTISVQAQKEFTIEGKVKGLEDGTVIALAHTEGRLIATLATDTVKDESFRFKWIAENETPECMMLLGQGKGFPSTWLDVWTAPGTQIKVSGSNKLIRAWQVESDLKEQKELNRYSNATRIWEEERLKSDIQVNELFDIIYGKNSEEVKQEARKKKNLLRAEQDSLELLFILPKEIEIMQQTSSNTAVWMNKLERLSQGYRYQENFPFRKETIALYQRLTPEQKAGNRGKSITINIFPPTTVKVGDTMADADLYDLEGKVHRLNDFKGKVMLLDFWSCGCGPCIMSIPELRKLSETYKENLHVISISQDDKKNWKSASERHNITWNNLNDFQGTNGICAKYDTNAIPFYVIISPEGTLVKAWAGYAKGSIESNLRKMLEQKRHTPTVEKVNGSIVVNQPIEKSSNTSLTIKKVVFGDTGTIIHAKIFFAGGQWIRISPETYLTDGKNKYMLLKAKGIIPGEQFIMPESNEAEFEFTFAPMPKETKSFDFIEGTSSGDWQILGVSF